MLPVVSKAWAKAKPQTVYGMVDVFLFEAGIIGDVIGLERFTGRFFAGHNPSKTVLGKCGWSRYRALFTVAA